MLSTSENEGTIQIVYTAEYLLSQTILPAHHIIKIWDKIFPIVHYYVSTVVWKYQQELVSLQYKH